MKTLSRQIPSSIYRLQLGKELPLKKVVKLLPYLHDLGLEGIYCSPLFHAVSDHGYDVLDPLHLNPILGTFQDLLALKEALQALNMKLILDIVPNHMSILSPLWLDVMAYGPNSPYASFFDIEWEPEKKELQGKVLLPILSSTYGIALDTGVVKLEFIKESLSLCSGVHRLPLSLESYALLFKIEKLNEAEETLLKNLHALLKGVFVLEKIVTWKEDFHKYLLANPARLQELLNFFNSAQNRGLLHQLLEKQYYRLSHWLVATQEVNYRRFFYVNDLAALCMEKPQVFQTYHQWIKNLIESEIAQGLRIDHPDGLLFPEEYFEQIQKFHPSLVIIEKILGAGEKLPENWLIDGTVGYEFLNCLNNLFLDPARSQKLTTIYEQFIGEKIDCEALIVKKKKIIIYSSMAAEVNGLGVFLSRIAEKNRYTRDFTRNDLTRALSEIIAHFPIYRTYIIPEKNWVSQQDADVISLAIERAKADFTPVDPSIFEYIQAILLLQFKHYQEDKEDLDYFVRRFQQVTAPIMAKGFEDTFLFTYNRLLSVNEVGGNPKQLGCSIKKFHHFNKEKKELWPLGFLPTSTHDTKRSEDVRNRLNVLSEIPALWKEKVDQWAMVNRPLKVIEERKELPDPNTEYYIYQTLVGIWPEQLSEREAVEERVVAHILKAVRESKTFTSWNNPNLFYEKRVEHFVRSLFTHNPFLDSFLPFQQQVALYGLYNTLSLTAIKIGSPGIVDLYQGSEDIFLALTDPDNRLPINIDTLQKRERDGFQTLCEAKGFIYKKGLNLRGSKKSLFLEGTYSPLTVRGNKSKHIIAFQRKWNDEEVIVVGSRFFTQLFSEKEFFSANCFSEEELVLPAKKNVQYKNIFTDTIVHAGKRKNGSYFLPCRALFSSLPCAILTKI